MAQTEIVKSNEHQLDGGYRYWMGAEGVSQEDIEAAAEGSGMVGDAQILVADPLAEVLLGDMPGVRRPSVADSINGDDRVWWVWSGEKFHWLPGSGGHPGARPTRLLDLRQTGLRVVVDADKCPPRNLDHRRNPVFRHLTTKPDVTSIRDSELTLILHSGAVEGNWRNAVRQACDGADLIVIDPSEFHSNAEAAYAVVCAGAMSIPVVVTTWNETLERVLAPSVVEVIARRDEDRLLSDAFYRDQVGVNLRREVLDHHSVRTAWDWFLPADASARKPSVLVMISSIRPEYLPQVVQYLNNQTYVSFEAEIVVDRRDIPAEIERQVAETATFRYRLRKNVEPVTVGEIYNAMMRRSDADIAVIWDDDDHYAAEHLRDLVQALVHSGASMAAKWAEFFHLAGSDVTIQRIPDGRYQSTVALGGSNLAMWRAAMLSHGGFRPMVSGYDQDLVKRVRDAGGITYRTHGYGYVAARRASGHLWDASDDLFLKQSVRQWHGLELLSTGFAQPDDALSKERYR